MGCCIGTANAPSESFHTPNLTVFAKTAPREASVSKSPPPAHPIMEEETVKEVLSEVRTVAENPPGPVLVGNSPFIKSPPSLSTTAGKDHQSGLLYEKPFTAFAGTDVLEVGSEICSNLGECESVCTNPTEKSEETGAEHLRHLSPVTRGNASFNGHVKREKAVCGSPSSGRARSGIGRRVDSGESSCRRSKSPATRTDSGLMKAGPRRSPSPRRTNKSPCRVGSGLGERVQKLDKERNENDGGDRRRSPTSDESLENPLVSLECFIFL